MNRKWKKEWERKKNDKTKRNKWIIIVIFTGYVIIINTNKRKYMAILKENIYSNIKENIYSNIKKIYIVILKKYI